jgi:Tfp pilus assembly protein PilO
VARQISPRERLLLLSAVALAALYFGARPLIGRIADLGPRSGKLLAEKTAVIAAYRQTVGRMGALQAESLALESGIAAHEKALLPGATPPLAAADLQTVLKQLADRAGLKIQSEKILAHVKKGAYLEIPVQIVAGGDIRTVKDFIVAVESSPVFISVQDMSLRTVKRRQFLPETRTYADFNDIQASMTLVGLIRGERG